MRRGDHQRPDIVMVELTRQRALTQSTQVDVGIHSLFSREQDGSVPKLGGAEARKRNLRGPTAEAAGARFIPFIASGQGHVGAAGGQLLKTFSKEMEPKEYIWLRHRLTAKIIEGTFGVASRYWRAISRLASVPARAGRTVVVGE